ncbi:hypothetical protein ACLOJK_015410 [Asimina triloba]
MLHRSTSMIVQSLKTRGFSTSAPEKIVASVVFERLPVVIPKIDPVVYAFQEFSFRWRQQYQRKYPNDVLDKSDSKYSVSCNDCNNLRFGGNLNFLSSYLEYPDSLPWVSQSNIVRFGVAQLTSHGFKTRHTKLTRDSTFKPPGSLSPFRCGIGVSQAHYLPPGSFPNHTYWRGLRARPDYNAPRPRGNECKNRRSGVTGEEVQTASKSKIVTAIASRPRGKGDYQIDYVPAPRITEADKTNDRKYAASAEREGEGQEREREREREREQEGREGSLKRALDRRLYLLLYGSTYGATEKKPVWHFPEKVYENEETLRKCAESALKSVIGDLSHTYFVGNAPFAHMAIQPTEDMPKLSSFKQFFFKSQVIGANKFKIGECEDHVWVTKDELMEYFPERAAFLNQIFIIKEISCEPSGWLLDHRKVPVET